MTAPRDVPEILLCGRVLVRRARDGGWVVGEPYGYGDHLQLVRPAYYGSPGTALTMALCRALELCPGQESQKLLKSLLPPEKKATEAFPAWGLAHSGAWLRTVRREAGLTQRRLAQLSGVSPRQIRRIEGGGVQPRADTLLNIFAALSAADLSTG